MKKLDFGLYVITGENYHPGRTLEEVMREALHGGADIVQLRHKTAKKDELLEKARLLRRLTREYGVPFIVNDDPELALEAEADGVHLGQEDGGWREARERLGPDAIIGISTHSLEQALAAEDAGADYIGVGPVFPTETKPGRPAVTLEYVRQASRHVRVPWVAIGGIGPHNAQQVLGAGATRLCAVSAIVGSASPAQACRELKAMIAAARGRRNGQAYEAGRELAAARAAGETNGWAAAAVDIVLNGGPHRTAAGTLERLVEERGLSGRRIVAEADGQIVPREEWSRCRLRRGMAVELVHFVGGG
ncbi:thiamine phosphate synthase [Paenibacillus sp. FSL W8-1187]|uniref:thiamine phosphate synthase n=1 Tax=Paenibacillus sp. FSL W8-1187 TaxID=2975339 RepID=UPI0030D8E769